MFGYGLSPLDNTVREEHGALAIEELRQSVRQTLNASLDNGRLVEAFSTLKQQQEVESLRHKMKETLQRAVANGRLHETMTEVKKKRKSKATREVRTAVEQGDPKDILRQRLRQAFRVAGEE